MISEERLKEVVGVILEIDPSTIGQNTNTDTVADWDSLKHMRLVIALEEAFQIVIPDDDVVTMTSFPIIKLVVQEQVKK